MISTQAKRGFLVPLSAMVLALGAAFAGLPLAFAGQIQPALLITSPLDGSVVTPGQTISVSVTSPANISFQQVFVIGVHPLPTSAIANSVPAQFLLVIPQNISLGKHFFTAWGTTSTGHILGSGPVNVDVERSDLPTRISADPDQVIFESQGERQALRIQANFSDGNFYDATRSSKLAFSSSNTSVATVDQNGTITAMAAGVASVTATFAQGTQNVQVIVSVTVPPPVLAPSPTSLSFNGQNVATSSSPQTETITNVSSNQGLKVGPVSVVGDFSETDNCLSSSPIPVGGMCTINVTFRPTAAGNRTGAVSVPDSMSLVPLTISVVGTGLAPPSISSLNPTSGPIGTSVTIVGANSGPTQGTGTAMFSGTRATPTSWSATSIVPPALPQGQPQLQITSPTSGIVISPGQVLPVTVSSPTPSAFIKIIVQGQGVLGLTDIATSLPAQFSLTVPANVFPGEYTIWASGVTTGGAEVNASPIVIDVERSDLPTKITAMPFQLAFETQGQKEGLDIWGNFADGSYVYLNASSYMIFSSSNTAVVTVYALGTATSVATGSASITATYTVGSESVQVNVPVTVDPPLLTSSSPSLTFGNQAVGTTSAAQALTLTNVSNGPIKVLALGLSGGFTETDNCVSSSSPLLVGGTCVVNVKFTPPAADSISATLDITNDFTAAQISIPLRGTGTAAVPSITSLSPTSGPIGTSVTIAGANFGATQGTSTVTFNNTNATPTSWSTTTIVVPVPSGATTDNVVVTVGGVASNGVSFTVGVPAPSITNLDPPRGGGGTSVTITGTNFGATQGASTLTI